jgi:hypothetical protein
MYLPTQYIYLKFYSDDNDLRVLSDTHRPTNEQEEKRVKTEGGRITGERNKRLNGIYHIIYYYAWLSPYNITNAW